MSYVNNSQDRLINKCKGGLRLVYLFFNMWVCRRRVQTCLAQDGRLLSLVHLGAEVQRELRERRNGWAIVTNDWACIALPEMKDLCIAIQYTPGVCCFLWVPVVMQHSFMMSIIFNTPSGDWRWCQQFFGSRTYGPVQFSVTLSTKDFPHHSVFKPFCCSLLFFNVSDTFSEVICHCSQHICLWSWAETLFFVNTKATFLQEELARSTWLWEETSSGAIENHFFSSQLLSLCTVEEPRVPTLEVTLITSCWLLHVSLCSAVEVRTPTPQRKKNS